MIAHVLHRHDLAADLALRRGSPRQEPYQFLFLCLNGIRMFGEHWGKEGVNIIDLGRRPDINFQVAMKIRRVVRRQGVRLLHAHLYTSFFYAAALRGPSKNPPLPFTEHVTAIGCFVKPPLHDNAGIAGGRLELPLCRNAGPSLSCASSQLLRPLVFWMRDGRVWIHSLDGGSSGPG